MNAPVFDTYIICFPLTYNRKCKSGLRIDYVPSEMLEPCPLISAFSLLS